MKLKMDAGALLRLALLHLTNAIGQEAIAGSRYGKTRRVPLNRMDTELIAAVELCAEAMARPRVVRKYTRRKVAVVPPATRRKATVHHLRRAA